MIPEKSRKLRVLIVDDSSFMRMAIRSILNRDPDIEIVGTAINGAEGVSKATTEAVVLSSVLILVWDYFITSTQIFVW